MVESAHHTRLENKQREEGQAERYHYQGSGGEVVEVRKPKAEYASGARFL